MKISHLIILLLCVFFIGTIHYQLNMDDALPLDYYTEEDRPVWLELMEEAGDVHIEEARIAFDEYWSNHAHYKGDRSKQFERWYELNARRLDQEGKVISNQRVREIFRQLSTFVNPEREGAWFNYGPITVGPRNNGDRRDGGRVKDIAFHPLESKTFLVSTFKGGLFRTNDKAESWQALTDHLPHQVFIARYVRENPESIFIGTDMGVLKSSDEGNSWVETGLTTDRTAGLWVNDDGMRIVAGNHKGIYLSEDGGLTFSQVLNADRIEEVISHPNDDQLLYASSNGSTSEFYRSEDGGRTWSDRTSQFGRGAYMKIAVTPARPDWVFAMNSRDHLGDDSFEGVYKSIDKGVTFTKISGTSPCIVGYDSNGGISRGQPNYNLFITVDPANPNIIYAGGVKSWRSVNGGVSWNNFYDNITEYGFSLHLDQLTWAHSPLTNKLFAVNDGGVYELGEDNIFYNLTDGLPIAEVWECTQSQNNPANVAGGTFHCGVKLNRDGVWYSPWGGDEATCIFDYSDDNYVYHLKYEKISRSVDGGFTFQRISAQDADRGYYTGTGTLDRSDVNTLYVGLFEVERTTNVRSLNPGEINWEKISAFGGSQRIYKIEQADADHDIMYVSREGNRFYRTDNLNASQPQFENLTAQLPSTGLVTDIATHPTEGNTVYILQGSRIYKSTDKGKSWMDITSNLPGVALLEMIYDRKSTEGIYIGTDIGVYYKDDSMTEWIDFSKGLPMVRVSGMDIFYGDTRENSFITISTDGRGFWRSELYGVEAKELSVDFEADKTNLFIGEKVTFTDLTPDVQVGTFYWEFPGGNPSRSRAHKPEVYYQSIGTYPVKLTYYNGAGEAIQNKESYINVVELPSPVADFSSDVTTVAIGNYVNFKDQTENIPSSWSWIFAGGIPATSTAQNPVVKYEALGTYDVSLIVHNDAGADTLLIENYINVIANSGSGDLQVQYNFSNDFTDASSYLRNLIATDNYTPSFTEDKDGNSFSAYSAPGKTGQYLFTGYKGIASNEARTVTAWFKTTAAGSRKTIVSWGRNNAGEMFNVMIHNGRVRVEGGTCNVQNNTAGLDDNAWHHVAVVYHPDFGDKFQNVKIYIDGELDGNEPDSGESYNSEAISVNTDNTINDLRIGSAEYNGNYFWQGDLDDIRVYSKALDDNQIAEIFANGSLSTGAVNNNSEFRVFPNPVKDKLNIELDNIGVSSISIYRINGQLLMTNATREKVKLHTIDISDITPGIYLLVLKNNNEKWNIKFVKE